jgi:hydrogenase-4 component F
MFMAAALALCGLPLSGVFRSEFEIIMGGFSRPQYVAVSLMLVFVNVAFFGIVWHSGRMVLSRRPGGEVPGQPGERSRWMVAGMLGCMLVSVALGIHLPGDLATLLGNAGRRLGAG